ncbi:hypothetical protein [Nocardioides aurantiacus]|uniref:Uncharacterized protein n=1 Tax=Nocardioides aurantiacus TaxID=86796 RepID=A0A3N2CYN4_9ACTN|nr:hypothetical protein [Nocardioides aurantiacus]ROR92586.1 hypothetical protein EDD33_3477 [Nocardioides aurantiacus]
MAKINKALFAVDVAGTAYRTNLVLHDPAVHKAADTAWVDIKQAGRSSGALVREVVESWHRNAPDNRVRGVNA